MDAFWSWTPAVRRLALPALLALILILGGSADGRPPTDEEVPTALASADDAEAPGSLAGLFAGLLGGASADDEPGPAAAEPADPETDAATAPEEPAPGAGRPIAIYRNDTVDSVVDFLLRKKRDVIERGWARSGRYLPMIRETFAELGLPRELAYLAGVESNFYPKARSPAHAVGMWQLMSATARKFGLRIHYPWYDERLDPEKATRAAGRFLAYLYDRYESWELALAAYNAGEGRVNRAMRRAGTDDYWSLRLPRQTRGFVPAFLAMATIYENPERYGLDGLEREQAWSGETVEMHMATTLEEIAQRVQAPLQALIDLNPAWKRGLIPPLQKGPVLLRLPTGDTPALQASLAAEPLRPIPWLVHRVREGQTVWDIAKAYGVRVRDMLSLNGLSAHSVIHIGQPLLVPLADDDAQAIRSQRERARQWDARTAGSNGDELHRYHVHRVIAGESLWTISRRYNVTMSELRHWNELDSNVLHPQQELKVFVPTKQLWLGNGPSL